MAIPGEHPRLMHQVGVRDGAAYSFDGGHLVLQRYVVGRVDVVSGELAFCDPRRRTQDDVVGVRVEPGSYPVFANFFSGAHADRAEPVNAAVGVILEGGGAGEFAPLGERSTVPPVDDPDDVEDTGVHFVGVDHDSLYIGDRAVFDRCWSDPAYADELVARDDGKPSQEIELDDETRVVRLASGFGAGGYPVFGGFAGETMSVVYVSFELALEDPPPPEEDDSYDEDTGTFTLDVDGSAYR